MTIEMLIACIVLSLWLIGWIDTVMHLDFSPVAWRRYVAVLALFVLWPLVARRRILP